MPSTPKPEVYAQEPEGAGGSGLCFVLLVNPLEEFVSFLPGSWTLRLGYLVLKE